MNKKLIKAVAPSIAAIAVAGSIVGGSTYALFTNNVENNIAITTGKIDVSAYLTDLTLYTPTSISTAPGNPIIDDTNAASGTNFGFGGNASLDGGTLYLNQIKPGDKASLKLQIQNESNILGKYRLRFEVTKADGTAADDETKAFFSEFKFMYDGTSHDDVVSYSSNWEELPAKLPEAGAPERSIDLSIEYPTTGTTQGKSCGIRFYVEAVQANANVGGGEEIIHYVPALNELNQTLKASEKVNKYPHAAVLEAMGDSTFEATFPKVEGYQYAWDITNDEFRLVKDGDLYPNGVEYYVFNYTLSDVTKWNNYSSYLAGSFEGEMTTSKGIDVGFNSGITSIKYVNESLPQDVVIRTAGGSLEVDASKDVVKHYGSAESLELISVAPTSYHEYGNTGSVVLNKGRIVFENENSLSPVLIKSNNAIVAVAENVSEPEVTIDRTSNVNTYKIQTTENDNGEKITETVITIQSESEISASTTDKGGETIITPTWIEEGANPSSKEEETFTEENAVTTIKSKEDLVKFASDTGEGKVGLLLVDLTDVGEIKFARDLTIDGNGHYIMGNSTFKVTNANADVTIKNFEFKYIHNEKTKPDYAFGRYNIDEEYGEGTLSAIYASSFAGSLNIQECIFDTADWDAVQITPVAGVKIVIKNNIFKHTAANMAQIRYIHIEAKANTEVELSITNNLFYNTVATGGNPIANIGAYYLAYGEKTVLSHNWFESKEHVDIKKGSSTYDYYIYPIRTTDNIEADNLYTPAARSVLSPYTYSDTIQEVIDSGTASFYLMRDNNEEIYIPKNGKTYQLQGDFKLTNKVTIDGNLQLFTGKSKSSLKGATIINNGYFEISNNDSWFDYTIENNGRLYISGTGKLGQVADPTIIHNHGSGKVVISGGNYVTKPDESFIAFGYTANLTDGVYVVGKIEFADLEEAMTAGAIGKYVKSGTTYYVNSLSGIETTSTDLLKDVNEDVYRAAAMVVSAGNYKFTGSINAKGFGVTFKSGTAEINNIECTTFKLGSSSSLMNVSVHGGNITSSSTIYGTIGIDGEVTFGSYFDVYAKSVLNITNGTYKSYFTIKAGATVNISGGTFTKVPTATSKTFRNSGTLVITGGTFKFDPSEYLTEDYQAIEIGDGFWAVTAK